jgi:hypothetical protein
MVLAQHTIIIDDVPVLPLSAKNEARRLITLLDALCETLIYLRGQTTITNQESTGRRIQNSLAGSCGRSDRLAFLPRRCQRCDLGPARFSSRRSSDNLQRARRLTSARHFRSGPHPRCRDLLPPAQHRLLPRRSRESVRSTRRCRRSYRLSRRRDAGRRAAGPRRAVPTQHFELRPERRRAGVRA